MLSIEVSDPSYQQRIEALAETKVAHTRVKLARGRTDNFDVDDHGDVPWPEPLTFVLKPNHPNGSCYGARSRGGNFRAWLEAHPIYIHPMSSLAGCWVDFFPANGFRPEDLPKHLEPLYREYNIVHTGVEAMNHFGPDMTIGLELGWGGLLRKIRHYRALNRPADTSFYDAEENVVLGTQDFIRRHVVRARELAATEQDRFVRRNLLEIAEMNDWLVENPPRTLREACQFLAWFQSIDRMYCSGGGLAQLDELLRPYYESDLAAGIHDDEAAIWHVASLLFNDTHYSQIGGPAPDGHDLTSPMSFLILEAVHRLRIPSNLAIDVHDGLDPALLRRSVEYLFADGTGPCYLGSKGLDEGYARNGVPIGLARMRAKVGCNWTALPGIEYCLQDVSRTCLVSPFLHAFYDVVADAEGPRTMESLWDRYVHHLSISVDTMKRSYDWHLDHKAANSPELVLNLFCHGTIERGLDVSAGGVDIYNLTLDGVGLATVADSLAAIEQRVVQEKRLTWEELAQVLRDDFAGAENVRLMLKNIPRFGTGGSRADYWAKRVSDLWVHLVWDTPTPKGVTMIPGLFSHGVVFLMGKNLGATPNGRHAGGPISHGPNPDPGFAPTAKANAVAAVQPGRGNTAPLQLDIDRGLAKSQGGVEVVEALIKGHVNQGGTLININIVSKQQILEAHADPEKFPDLVVRVTGYSAYFRMLSPEYRQQVVDRLLAEA